MELHNKLLMPNHSISRYAGFLAMYFGGPAPTDAASLKAAIDIYDFEDVYNKCLGFATLRSMAVSSGSLDVIQAQDRVSLKGSPIKYNIPYAMTAIPTLQLGSPPDRIAVCNGAAPYDKVGKLGMAGITRMHLMPWAGLDGAVPANDIPRSLGLTLDIGAVMAMEWEWSDAREFGGILRAGTDVQLVQAPHTLAVDAWVNGTWEQVLAPMTRPVSSIGYQIHHLFTKNVVTTKLRLRWSTTAGGLNGCHGCIPLEVKASTPDAKSVPTIEWAVLVPFDGYSTSNFTKTMERKDLPIPMFVANVGGPGDGAGFDLILSQKAGLVSSDLPSVTGLKLTNTNAKE